MVHRDVMLYSAPPGLRGRAPRAARWRRRALGHSKSQRWNGGSPFHLWLFSFHLFSPFTSHPPL